MKKQRKRKPAATFAAKVTAAGQVITDGSRSTAARIREIISQLGIDPKEYKDAASIRKYSRMAKNPYLFNL